jgi:hypothetical protein
MTSNAHVTRQHRSGSSLAEMPVAAMRALVVSLPEATRCAKRSDGHPVVEPMRFDDPGKR